MRFKPLACLCDSIDMLARRTVRPVHIAVPIDDEREPVGSQESAKLGQRIIAEFVQHIEREDPIDRPEQRFELGGIARLDRCYAAAGELRPQPIEHLGLLVERDHSDVRPGARDLDRICPGAGAEVNNERAGWEIEQTHDFGGRKVHESSGVVELRRAGWIEAVGLLRAGTRRMGHACVLCAPQS